MKYNVYKMNEETGEILSLVCVTEDITPFKDGVYDKAGYLVTLNKDSRIFLDKSRG